jgi:ribosomal protein S14
MSPKDIGLGVDLFMKNKEQSFVGLQKNRCRSCGAKTPFNVTRLNIKRQQNWLV